MRKQRKPKRLSDAELRNMPRAPKGQRVQYMDLEVPAFGVRVNEKGNKVFILNMRLPGEAHPVRLPIGSYAAETNRQARVFTLSDARIEARQWKGWIKAGIDPRDRLAAEKLANVEAKKNSFDAVAQDFIEEKLSSERRGKDAERDLRREFITRWNGRPIADISDLDVIAIIKAKRKDAPTQARNLLALAKRFFRWAKAQRVYGLAVSPIDGLTAKDLGLEVARRDRTLSDDEFFALWRASERLPYPAGACYRLLALTALRLNEAAQVGKDEIDRREGIWTVPAARMKGKDRGKGQARPHAVPLTGEIGGLFDELPKQSGRYLFSNTAGEKPAWIGDKIKKDLDKRMLLTLRALARLRRADTVSELTPWVNHDIRRSVRTRLSRLRVTEEAREAVLAHVRPGVKGTYDRHEYLSEKREALELWAAELRSIIWRPYRELRARSVSSVDNIIRFRR